MPKGISEKSAAAILEAVKAFPHGAALGEIEAALAEPVPRRTLQFRLRSLVNTARVITTGEGKAIRYSLPSKETLVAAKSQIKSLIEESQFNLSKESMALRRYLSQPAAGRKPTGYNRKFLDSYQPNSTFYLSAAERAELARTGAPAFSAEAAGTYAKQILHRLLIDLSWNSSRLEGNTYSLLDTKRLFEFGQADSGHDRLESQMVLNHKGAIEFLVASAEEISFNRYTILNLHAILAQNLLPDERAGGRLRNIPVAIERSTFHPLAVPQLVEECFDQILAVASAIQDPFEQALFVMAQLPYLQPFDDANKRVSRLAANIPFIKKNLSPLSFVDVPRDLYIEAVLGVYELNNISLLKDLFVWAYGRSAEQYAAVRQSLGEPDPFRAKHREALGKIVSEIIRGHLNKNQALTRIAEFAGSLFDPREHGPFREMAEDELTNLHEGNFARYRVTPSEFATWQKVWKGAPS